MAHEDFDRLRKLIRWRQRFLKFKLDIVVPRGVKHQSADAQSRLLTNGTDKASLQNNVAILVLTPKMFSQLQKVFEQEDEEGVIDEEKFDAPAPFSLVAFAVAGQFQELPSDIPDLPDFVQHKAHDNECR